MMKAVRVVVFLTSMVVALIWLLPLASCVSTSKPMPIGKDTYTISTTNWLLGGITNETMNAAIREANSHCASMGKEFVLLTTQGGGLPSEGMESNIHGRLVYRCVGQNESARKKERVSTGTGFFVSDSGHVVTNFHVVQESRDITVRTDRGKEFPAVLLSGDSANDVAILKVEAQTVPMPVVGVSAISKGSEVMTLGYPLVNIQGQEQKATFGRVNSLTGIGNDVRFLQIDVPIQPGNSGGPLISTHGVVVGIVSVTLNQVAAFKESGSLPQNVNYAVKADYVLPLLSSVINYAPAKEPTVNHSFEELAKEYERSVVLVIAR